MSRAVVTILIIMALCCLSPLSPQAGGMTVHLEVRARVVERCTLALPKWDPRSEWVPDGSRQKAQVSCVTGVIHWEEPATLKDLRAARPTLTWREVRPRLILVTAAY